MTVDEPNAPNDRRVLERLVAAPGATPVRHRNWCLCCGPGCQTEAIPSRRMRDLVRTVHDEGPDLMCLGCAKRFGQFDHAQLQVAGEYGEDSLTPADLRVPHRRPWNSPKSTVCSPIHAIAGRRSGSRRCISRNRKMLVRLVPPWEHEPPVWELRIGEYRAFYDVDEAEQRVIVRAVRRKPPQATTEAIL
jgi:hypothetical protein